MEPYEILFKDDKYKCCNCPHFEDTIEKMDKHLKLNCLVSIKYDNIYKYDKKTLAKFIFKNLLGAGEIYIVQIERNKDNLFKIGITEHISKRLGNYRTGSVYESRLHCYFPCKNLKLADQLMKKKLKKYNVKREHYLGDLKEIQNEILLCLKEINDNEVFMFEPLIKKNDISQCENCNKLFMTNYDLDNHLILNHSNEMTIINKNRDDNKIIKNNKLDLILFENEIMKKRYYQCKKCNKIFDHKNDYRRHYNRKTSCVVLPKTPPSKDELTCDDCGKEYCSIYILKQHKLKFCKFKNISINNSSVIINNILEPHKLNQEDDSKNQYNFISKKSKKPQNIYQKKYICEFCFKNFSRSDSLKRHLDGRCKEKKIKVNKEEILENLFNKMCDEMKKLKDEMTDLKNNNQNNIINNNNNLNNILDNNNINNILSNNTKINNNINIIPLAKENLDEIVSNAHYKNILLIEFETVPINKF